VTYKIYLSKDVASLRLNHLSGRVVCAYHHAYKLPDIRGAVFVPFAEFERDFVEHLKNCETLVVVGLNKIITPSTRTHEVFPVLYRQSHHISRISVDYTLFEGEPWRAYFHFGFVGANYADFPYSYAAERQYINWLDGYRAENLFSADRMRQFSRGVVGSTYRRLIAPPTVKTIRMSPEVHDEYQELKAHAFEHYGTPKKIIAELAAFAQKACPGRFIPQLGQIVRAGNRKADEMFENRTELIATDLKVDQYLVGRINEGIDTINAVAEECYDAGI
jgi:hypothetical protein